MTARRLPWDVNDLLRLYAINGVALLALLAAWWVAAGSVRNPTEVACLAVGVAAIIVSGTANCRWVLVGRRSVGLRRRDVVVSLEHVTAAVEQRAEDTPVPNAVVTTVAATVALSGSTRYHRQDCQLVAGKSASPASVASHERAGRRPCGICEP